MGYPPEPPLAKLKSSKLDTKGRVRYLTDAEEARVRTALSQRDECIKAARVRANAWRRVRGYAEMPSLVNQPYGDHLTPMVVLTLNTGLRRRCARWSQDVLPVLGATDPVMPESLHDRAADNWRPLCAIAEGAGGTWPQRAAQAIKALTPQELDDEAGALCFLRSECFMIRPRQAGTLGRTPGKMAIVRLCALRALRGATPL